ncbi:MFS transporter [Spelaeicoccus albus]|uniref:MFS family permease n=1 Tax=Spelaeicoccus albus TaxID=1280376 RepID=A0A7Z0D2U5_9MICO|nr:MFS transporter [Spelaeicoccus albus]NYI67845.1 MFS family permease [Spelaeicoccus albus]
MTKQRGIGLTLSALSLGTALNPLNSSMIAVALVVLRGDFDLSVATVTWVITSFYLTSAAAQPLMGRLADRFGPKRLFIIGMAIVAVTCALAGFSPNFLLVCIARVFMGIGTATAFPSAVAMVGELSRIAGVHSTKPLGYIQVANTAGAAIGPVVGGLLVSLVGWQALFFINVPLALAALISVQRLAPADDARDHGTVGAAVRDSDIPGIATFIAALVSLMLAALNPLPDLRWILLGVGIAAAALFTWRELRFSGPFLDVRLLAANRPLLTMYVCFAVFNGVYYCAFFGLPQLLQEAGGYGAGVVGLLMLPLAAISVFLTPAAVRSINRRGVKPVLVAGVIGLGVASALLWLLAASFAVPLVLALTAFLGIPYCVVSIASSQGMYASSRPEDTGVAAGIFQTFRYIGAIGATVMIGILYAPGVNAASWSTIVPVMVGLSVVALVLAALWKGRSEVA